MLYKGVSNGAIKDVDTKTGTVTGYFSIFGNVDSDGDMIMPGAFTRTLNNNYKRVKHLNQHRSYEPLAATTKGNLTVAEDQKGLYFESKITPTTYGKDVIMLYQDGVIDEHSIGYEVVKEQKAKNYNELLELKLWEGSTVTWGANSEATTESIKSLSKEQAISKMSGILKALKHGKYEQEEIFEMLELHFKQLEQHILDLSTSPAKAMKCPDCGTNMNETDNGTMKCPSCGKTVAPKALNPPKSVDVLDTDMILSFIQLQTINSN
jgi:uncharacterized protein